MDEKKWFLIDDDTTNSGCSEEKEFDSKEDALTYAEMKWHHLTGREQSKRDDFFVGLFEVDEDGYPTACWEVAKDYKEDM